MVLILQFFLLNKFWFLIIFFFHSSNFPCKLEYVVFQTLDIVAENPDKFRIVGLAAGSNVTLLADQVLCKPNLIHFINFKIMIVTMIVSV